MFGLKAYEIALRKKGVSVPVMEAALKLHKIYMESGFSSDDDAPEAVDTDSEPEQTDTGDADLTQLIDGQPARNDAEEDETDNTPVPHVDIYDDGSETYKDKKHKCALCGETTDRTSKYDAYTDGDSTHYTGNICDMCFASLSAANSDEQKFMRMYNTLVSNSRMHKVKTHSENGLSTPDEAGDSLLTSLTPRESVKDSPEDIHPDQAPKISRGKRIASEMDKYAKLLADNGEDMIPDLVGDKASFINRMKTAIADKDVEDFDKCKRIMDLCSKLPSAADESIQTIYSNLVFDAVDNDDPEAYAKITAEIEHNYRNERVAKKNKWDKELAERRSPNTHMPKVSSEMDLGKAKDIEYPLTMATPNKRHSPVSTISGPDVFTQGYETASNMGRRPMIDKTMSDMVHGPSGILTPGSEDYNPMLAAKIAKNAPEDSPWGKELRSELKDKVLPMASDMQKLDFIKDFPDSDKLDVLKELADDPETAPLIDEYIGNNSTMSSSNIIQLATDSMPKAEDGVPTGNVGDPENPQAQLVKIAINLHSGKVDRKEIMDTINDMSDANTVAMFSLLTPEAVQKIIGCNEEEAQDVVDGMADPDLSEEDKKDLITENSSLYKLQEIKRRKSANKSRYERIVNDAKNRIRSARTGAQG